MSPATLQTCFSFMRTLAGWIGKPHLLKPIASHFDDPALHRRSLAAKVDKTWRAQGVDADQVIYDRHAAASLRLMQAFGLRFKEGLLLRPHQDVLTAPQASRPACSPARDLDMHRGTKGGCERLLPINKPAARSRCCAGLPRGRRPRRQRQRPAAHAGARRATASLRDGTPWHQLAGGGPSSVVSLLRSRATTSAGVRRNRSSDPHPASSQSSPNVSYTPTQPSPWRISIAGFGR